MNLSLLVEGRLDEAMGRRLAAECGLVVERVYGKQGWRAVRDKIKAFNKAAKFAPCFALVDFMDTQIECPPGIVTTWTPDRHANMVFRVVVRELESWILADREAAAKFLHVPINRLPQLPEMDPDPKHLLIGIARRSRSARVKTALVPRQGASATVGPEYNPFMEHFILDEWRPAVARAIAPSLDKCLTRLEELRARLGQT